MTSQIKTSVPVVDYSALVNGDGKHQALAILDTACRKTGFFYLANHGIFQTSIARVWQQADWFFRLPLHEKQSTARSESNSRGYYNQELTKNVRDMKEVFDFGHLPFPGLPDAHPGNRTPDGWNQWPVIAGHQEFKDILNDYYRACGQIAIELLRALTSNLGAAVNTLTGDFHPDHSSFLRLNYYPVNDPLGQGSSATGVAAETGHLGVHHHADAGALTLLLQDDVGGLEIFFEDAWIPVDPLPGTLVVNIGDIVQVWSNDQYIAPLHRVIASSRKDRFSVPFFFNPVYEANYGPLPEAIQNGETAHYGQINWGNFRRERQHGDYGDYGDEIQASDFRL